MSSTNEKKSKINIKLKNVNRLDFYKKKKM